MRLSKRHANQQTISYRDFSGGLNTTDATESIAPNELARAVNVCLDKSTGLLQTIAGTDVVYRDNDYEFDCLIVDPLYETILISTLSQDLIQVDRWKGVYVVDDNGTEYAGEHQNVQPLVIDGDGTQYTVNSHIGKLTGPLHASYAAWENGLLIASGGKLQYYYDGTLETLNESPSVCNGVFVRDGRVWTWHDDRIELSAVGDEHDWTHDNNVPSSAQYVDIGYKDRGNIKGIVALSSDVVIFKDNGHAYHLLGQYPDWQVKSIGRQLGIKNYDCCINVSNSVLVLGDGRIQSIEVTQDYGDMKAKELSSKVEQEVSLLDSDTRVRYVPLENEVWFIGTVDNEFLTLNVDTGGFYKRRYSTKTRDVATLKEDTYILKEHCLTKVNNNHMMTDEGTPLEWEFQTATMVTYNDVLVKRVYVDTTPIFDIFSDQRFKFGDVEIFGGLPPTARFIFHNYGNIYHNRRYICAPYLGLILTDRAEPVFQNDRFLFQNTSSPVRALKCYRSEIRCTDHRRSVPIVARGSGGITLFNQVAVDVVEIARYLRG